MSRETNDADPWYKRPLPLWFVIGAVVAGMIGGFVWGGAAGYHFGYEAGVGDVTGAVDRAFRR